MTEVEGGGVTELADDGVPTRDDLVEGGADPKQEPRFGESPVVVNSVEREDDSRPATPAAQPPEAERGASSAEPDDDRLAGLVAAVEGLTEQVRSYHARAKAREGVIDQLHSEVERLRVGEQGLLLRPVVTDLQRLRGDLLHQADTLPSTIRPDQTRELLESFALSVELALERCGSVPIRPPIGAAFSAREHRAVKVLPAAGPHEDGTIALVVADGYQDSATGRTVAPARVHVRRWTELDQADAADPATAGAGAGIASERRESSADV